MTTDTVGGVWTYTLGLLREYALRGVQTLVVSLGRLPTSDQASEVARIDGVTLIPTDLKLEWMQEPWSDVEACGQLLLQAEQTFCPDVVHLNGFAHGALPFRAPKLTVAHSCVLSWWRAVKGNSAPGPEWNRYRNEVEAGLNKTGLIVAPTQAMLDMLRAEYVYATPSRCIYNGCDREGECAETIHEIASKPVVFCAGRVWDEAKNISTLAAASPCIDGAVVIAGEGGQLGAGANAPENVRFVGALDREAVKSWMRRASVYCLPALYEPFGLSVLEAAQAGCALVLGDIPTLRELWGPDDALFVEPRDPRGVAREVNRLLQDEELRALMRARARERARAYTSRRVAQQYMAAYEELASLRR